MRRLSLSLTALVCAGLALAGCSKSDDSSPKADTSPTASKTAEKPEKPDTWPLTGLTANGGAALDHPVLVTKMDNTTSSAPQVGLGKADMVVEELVEGGLTRLAAFFYSDIPDRVGPVRSMRASDIDIVSPVKASVVTSGAAMRTINLIRGAHIPFYGESTKGFARDNSRMAPYNLFANLSDVATVAKTKPTPVKDYFHWGKESAFPKGVKATTINAQFSGGHTTEWKYAGGKYVNVNSNAPQNDQFPATTVLVLRVREGDAGYLDPAGNPVPQTLFTGQGVAQVFHGGQMVSATWHKGKAPTSVVKLTTKKGKLKLPPGHVWVELVPIAGNVTFSK